MKFVKLFPSSISAYLFGISLFLLAIGISMIDKEQEPPKHGITMIDKLQNPPEHGVIA